ncbi:hypothetical protein J1N35_000627 [Gossypium stocksii]|uniref:Uncharacterized protein n=1 Tax=Gossypium stocksii TaxID=47602 RepID=A0A9D3WH69_9ROSI|nr:hypothetical protein J1N35_000627 [Gossypium stocksii]
MTRKPSEIWQSEPPNKGRELRFTFRLTKVLNPKLRVVEEGNYGGRWKRRSKSANSRTRNRASSTQKESSDLFIPLDTI